MMFADLGSLLSSFLIDVRVHTGKDTSATNCHVRIFMSDQDSRGNAVVTTTCRVGSVDTYDNRNTKLVQLSVAEERCTTTTTVRVYFVLIREPTPDSLIANGRFSILAVSAPVICLFFLLLDDNTLPFTSVSCLETLKGV